MAIVASFVAATGLTWVRKSISAKTITTLDNDVFNWRQQAVVLLSFVAALIFLYGIVSKFAGIGQALKYNLVEVPADQFWYFGAPPNDFAKSIIDIGELSWRGIILLLAVSIWLMAKLFSYSAAASSIERQDQFVVTHLLCYGLASCASCLGMLERGYLLPMTRVFALAILVELFRSNHIQEIRHKLQSYSPSYAQPTFSLAAIVLVCFFATMTFISIRRLPPFSLTSILQTSPQLSISWNKHFATVTQALREKFGGANTFSLWSTYSGLLENDKNVFLPREDYIIHALGRERRHRYLSAFRTSQPDVVQTIRRSHFLNYTQSHDYEQWLRNTTWDFYEDILNNYEILTATDRAIFWTRKSGNWRPPENSFQNLSIAPNASEVEIPFTAPAHSLSMLVVKVTYQIKNPWKRVPTFGGLPRYLIVPECTANALPISLSPYEQEIRFPVMLKPGAHPKFYFEVQSLLPGASFVVNSVSYKVLNLTDKQSLFLTD